MSTKKTEEDISVKHGKQRGTLKNFVTYRRFGYITPDGDPGKEVFVTVKNLVGYTGDEYPYLPKGIPVEFAMVQDVKGWRAQEVSQPGGGKLVSVDEDPAKNYNKDKLYTGTVHFFNSRMGYGFITADVEEIEWEGVISESKKVTEEDDDGEEIAERLAASVWFPGEEIVGPIDVKKQLNVGDKVQFHVYIGDKGLGAGKVLRTLKSMKKRKKGDLPDARKKRKRKRKCVTKMADIDEYLNQNYRRALKVYFSKRDVSISTKYETDKDPEDDSLFLTTARTVGNEDNTVEGTGRAANKKASVKAAALDLILNLGLVSKEEHEQSQDSNKVQASDSMQSIGQFKPQKE